MLNEQIENELQLANSARARGNEGMARVCARRAAGLAAGFFLQQQGLAAPGPSAYDRLRLLQSAPGLSPRARQAAARLTLRVDTSFRLPDEVDLLEEAAILIAEITSTPP